MRHPKKFGELFFVSSEMLLSTDYHITLGITGFKKR